MSEHTPGPWSVGRIIPAGRQQSASCTVDVPEQGGVIQVFTHPGHSSSRQRRTEERDANARLVAAAPELLEALKSLLIDCETTARERGYRPENFDNIRQARAIVVKAEGGIS